MNDKELAEFESLKAKRKEGKLTVAEEIQLGEYELAELQDLSKEKDKRMKKLQKEKEGNKEKQEKIRNKMELAKEKLNSQYLQKFIDITKAAFGEDDEEKLKEYFINCEGALQNHYADYRKAPYNHQ